MNPDDIRGEWHGTFAGTNTGRLFLRITPVPTSLVLEARLEDDQVGTSYLLGTGTIVDANLEGSLAAREASAEIQFGAITVRATLPGNGTLSGSWETTVGTSGTFVLSPPAPAPATAAPTAPPPAKISFFEKNVRTRACAVNLDVIRRIHTVLKEAASEAALIHERKQYTALPDGGQPELARRYRVMVIIRGAQGEVAAADDLPAIDADILPQPLTSIDFNIGFNYKSATGNEAFNRAVVRFDFSKPPAVDVSNPSSEPTPNESVIHLFGADTLWVAGAFERVSAIIRQTAVRSAWLHRRHAYDVLVWLLGFPLALLLSVWLGSRVRVPQQLNDLLFRLGFAWVVALFTLMGFRIAFSLTRWLLPYVEYTQSPEPLHRRLRVLIAGGMFAIATSVLASLIYSLFG